MKIVHLNIPEYTNTPKLDLKLIAVQIDRALVDNFNGQILLRAVSSEAHECAKSELVKRIQQYGTDRYNPKKVGDRYENIEGKQIDLFGRIITIKPKNLMSKSLLDGFHIYGAEFHNKPSDKMDIWLIYDRKQLKSVRFTPLGQSQLKRDGYIFKNPTEKLAALLGIVVIN